jgi:hypothetical protein
MNIKPAPKLRAGPHTHTHKHKQEVSALLETNGLGGQSTGAVGFHRVRDLRQFFLGGLTRREQALILECLLARMIGVPMASV